MGINSRNKVSVSFSMSSMTDIVFLLLIFFIILSTLVSPYGAKVDLPTGKNRTKEHPKISVSIRTDLSYNLDGQDVSKSQIKALLLKRKAEVKKPSIVLNVDQTVPTGETIGFLSLAKENGFTVVIATKP
ncbi:MAG: biopolymer transporter ExbD [Flavobacteriales bacterium]|jgi:biopolymer transport protein ExbD|nr:biopolymer transporter ExbD [Flavobacteriales bacterium]NCG30536.1 biopolymer transporter ExbD [Bacteroidota bacterium]MBT3964433.1 biopolymer transporter ExbD [Flavobacteriales bacterium]MBT4705096.1 biopolymer transporter ExbD [Flavobacteriales bacterium]MBT4930116.1 biopolymer transporter ExbD [Flavobacteriales bacterium]